MIKGNKYNIQIMLILLIVIFNSCGKVGTASNNGAIDFKSGINLNAKISVSEQSLALSICYSIKKKRIEFITKSLGKQFLFSTSQKNCSNNITKSNITSILTLKAGNSSIMTFESGAAPAMFYKEVQTDVNGTLKGICLNVLGGREPSLVSNNGTEQTELHFKRASNGNLYFELKTANSNSNTGISNIFKIEQFYVHPINGRINKIKTYFSCIKKNVYDEYEQVQI